MKNLMETLTSNKKIKFKSNNNSNVIQNEDTINVCISISIEQLLSVRPGINSG